MKKAPNENEILNYMQKLDLTREEALELWECDHSCDSTEDLLNEEQKALEKKAYKVGCDIKKVRDTKAKGKKKNRERKPDPVKAEILSAITNLLQTNFNVEVEAIKIEKMLGFNYKNEHYTLDLVRTRKPKTK